VGKILGGDFKKGGLAKAIVGFTGTFKGLQLQTGAFSVPTFPAASIASVRTVEGIDKKASIVAVTFTGGQRLLMSGAAKEIQPLIGYAFDRGILGERQFDPPPTPKPDYLELPIADMQQGATAERPIVYEESSDAPSTSPDTGDGGGAGLAGVVALLLAPLIVSSLASIHPGARLPSAVIVGLTGAAVAYLKPPLPILRHRAAAILFSIVGFGLALTSTPPKPDPVVAPAAPGAVAASTAPQPPAAPEPTQTAIASLSPGLPVSVCGDKGIATNEIMGVVGEVQFREKPSKSADRVINAKATNILGETQYQQIDGTTMVRELCKQGPWSEVQIVEPDWLSSHRGWVPSKFLKPIVKDASGQRVYSEENFVWDSKSTKHKKIIIAGVNKVARENKECAKIDPGTASVSSSKGTTKNPVFFVTCEDASGRAFNVFFSSSDVKADKSLLAIKPLDRDRAVQLCEEAAKDAALHPSTVDFSRILNLAVQDWAGGRVRVISKFSAQNSLGVELSFDISCLFEGNRMLEALVSESRS
jgi:hypothetical protein